MFPISFKFNDSHKEQKRFQQNTFNVNLLNGNINDLYEQKKSNKSKPGQKYFSWKCSRVQKNHLWFSEEQQNFIFFCIDTFPGWGFEDEVRDLDTPVARFSAWIWAFIFRIRKIICICTESVALIKNCQCSPVVSQHFEDSFTIDRET